MKFSVTIPAYKSKFLKEAIESVLCQSYMDFELIIVDDHSPEDLKSIVAEFSDPRIRYYRNEKNCGAIDVVDNWNICLSYCSGDYVICMGDDDRLTPCCLEEYERIIVKFPQLEVYHAQTEIIDESGAIIKQLEERPAYETGLEMLKKRFLGRQQYIGDFCYDVSRLRANGGFYKLPLAWCSDDITAFRAASTQGIANTDKVCFQYRDNRYTISNDTMPATKINALEQAERWYVDFFEGCNIINKNELIAAKKTYFSNLYIQQLLRLFKTDKRNVIFYMRICLKLKNTLLMYLKIVILSFMKKI